MKQRWYRSNITKTILIVLEHIFAVTAVVSLLWVLAYPAVREEIFEGDPAEKYEDSRNFQNQMYNYAFEVSREIGSKKLFETDGKFNPDKLVDVQEYMNSTTVSGKNSSGLAYRLGDLLEWGEIESYEEGEYAEDGDNVIVCKKSDGTFQYYKSSEFKKLVDAGKLQFVISGDDMTTTEILDNLMNQDYNEYSEQSEFKGLQNEEGKMEYIDCWSYDGYRFKEGKSPVGADSILDIVSADPKWNGRLDEAYNAVSDTILGLQEFYAEYQFVEENLAEGDTNFSFIYANTKTGQVYSNRKAFEDYDKLNQNLDAIRESGKFGIVYEKLDKFETNLEDMDAKAWRDTIRYNGETETDFIFAVAVDTEYPIQDSFYTENQLYAKYGSSAREIAVFGVVSIILFIVGLIWLVWVAGRSAYDEELHLCRFDYWKTEIAAVLVIGFWLAVMMSGAVVWNYDTYSVDLGYYAQSTYVSNSIPYIIGGAMLTAYTCALFLIGLLSLVRRIKARTLWRDSVLRCICRFIKHVFEHIHCIWKSIILFGIFTVLHWFAYVTYPSALPLFVVLGVEFAAFVYFVYNAIGSDKMKKGIKKIAGGEVDYKIPLQGLYGEQKIIAEEINSIGDGLDAALEESMKSERLKTDLITNVSHDIKTPLTSIINYVNLLKQEEFEDPKVQHYIEVLEEKAHRLKILTEDVVEASKISSGNISLEYMNINFVEMIQQTSGEFEEKFAARNLKEVLNIPEEEAVIYADGRRMWRVLENIYSNAAKYAMKGSRVYADLAVTDEHVIFSLKNVSEQPLNISADELTERFIRGDVSRSTEGSGLGLSIAKTLTQMQGGKFDLYLDGDLFKVTITFPREVIVGL